MRYRIIDSRVYLSLIQAGYEKECDMVYIDGKPVYGVIEYGETNSMGVKNQSATPTNDFIVNETTKELATIPAIAKEMNVTVTVAPNAERIARMLAEQEQHIAAHPDQLFPAGMPDVVYDAILQGQAFVFVGGVVWRSEDDPFKKGQQREVACIAIQFVDPEAHTLSDQVHIAQLQGGYIRQQIRKMTENELQAAIWTVARNETKVTPNAKVDDDFYHPRMLKLWESAKDSTF